MVVPLEADVTWNEVVSLEFAEFCRQGPNCDLEDVGGEGIPLFRSFPST